MTLDSALSQVRPIVHIAGTIMIACAIAKLFGISIPQLRAEHWQLAILGMGLKHF